MRWPGALRLFRWRKEGHVVRQREREADAELATSRRLLAEDRRRLVRPLVTEHQRNRFSEMIKDALSDGYDYPAVGHAPGHERRRHP